VGAEKSDCSTDRIAQCTEETFGLFVCEYRQIGVGVSRAMDIHQSRGDLAGTSP